MSWFDTGGLTTFARSALKEAQRTIDKALDIQDPDTLTTSVVPATNLKKEAEDFFAEYGTDDKKDDNVAQPLTTNDPGEAGSNLSTSIWGSFTGSFFDSNTASSSENKDSVTATSDVVASQPQQQAVSLSTASTTTTTPQSDRRSSSSKLSFSTIFSNTPTIVQSSSSVLSQQLFGGGSSPPSDSQLTANDAQEIGAASFEDGWGWNTQEMTASASQMLAGLTPKSNIQNEARESLVNAADEANVYHSDVSLTSVTAPKTDSGNSSQIINDELVATEDTLDTEGEMEAVEGTLRIESEDLQQQQHQEVKERDIAAESSIDTVSRSEEELSDQTIELPPSQSDAVSHSSEGCQIVETSDDPKSFQHVQEENINSALIADNHTTDVIQSVVAEESIIHKDKEALQSLNDCKSNELLLKDSNTLIKSETLLSNSLGTEDYDKQPSDGQQLTLESESKSHAQASYSLPDTTSLTVQPTPSPIKIVALPAVIESQITASSNDGVLPHPSSSLDKWNRSSSEEEEQEKGDAAAVTETVVHTITRQPTRGSVSLEENEQDEAEEGLYEASNVMNIAGTIDEHTPFQPAALMSTDEIQLEDTRHYIGEDSIDTNDTPRSRDLSESESIDTVLSAAIPLDMSVESGGSSDTITASMDSTQFAGSCMDGLEEIKELEREERLPRLLQEAIGEGESNISTELATQSHNEIKSPEASLSIDGDRVSDRAGDVTEDGSLKNETGRELSPSSSDSLHSEMVKIGNSEHTSGHTSGDEFETTTSSDIEVISSPSLDGISVYSGGYSNNGSSNNNMIAASRVWQSTHQRLKAFFEQPPAASGSNNGSRGSSYGTSGSYEFAVSPSMTASFTSISESDGGVPDGWDIGASSSSPPSSRTGKDPSMYFGHVRNQSNMSETSESSGEQQHQYSPAEMEQLGKKVKELTEVLEAREQRVLELSQQNSALQDNVHTLQHKLLEVEASGGDGGSAGEMLREEFTQRLAAMEKKFQQALREKEAVSKLLETARADAATRLSSSEVRAQIEEKDTIISELRAEGEKLSKQQLQYSTTIKKLRAKEKELESTVSTMSSKIEAQTNEIDRQHKQIVVKSEVERRQVAAITQLTVSLQQSEETLRTVRAEAAETEGKMTVLKEALDTAYRELSEAKRQETAREAALAEQSLSAEMGARQQLQEAMEALKRQADREKQALLLQVEELQEERDRVQIIADRAERQARNELSLLQQQLSESEGRGEELSSAVAAATRPLLRQIENLQASHAAHRQAWEEVEAQLTHRLQEAEKQAAVSAERERAVREQSAQAVALKGTLEGQIEAARAEISSLSTKVQSLSACVSRLEEEKMEGLNKMEEKRAAMTAENAAIKAECERLRAEMEVEKTALREERRKSEVLQQHLTTAQSEKKMETVGGSVGSRPGSPTPSLSRMSLTGSVASYMAGGAWADDVFDSASTRGVPSLYEAMRGNTATTVEALTSQLTQREGELHHLQSEVLRHEAQRETLQRELLDMTSQLQQMENRMAEYEQLDHKHRDINQKYNALLQMYGEKVEEVDELRLDLADVKEMYKAQINQLMQK